MVAAVVFDLVGVLRVFDVTAQTEAETAAGLAPGSIAHVALEPARIHQVVSGQISDEQWQESVIADLSALCDERTASSALLAWAAAGSVDQNVLGLIRRIRHDRPVVLLTNGTSSTEQDLNLLGLTDEFDGVVNSARTGYPKPHPSAFTAADRALGSALGTVPDPGRVLFIDDTLAHVQAARAHGWLAIHFTGVETLTTELNALGLLS